MILMLTLAIAGGAEAKKNTKASKVDSLTVTIKGMHCGGCAKKVKSILTQGNGAENVKVNLERNTATIFYNPTVVSADTLKARLAATKRYAPTAYSKNDVISRKVAYYIADMTCGGCAKKIEKTVMDAGGVDSVNVDIKKHAITVYYDANKVSRDDFRTAIDAQGYSPLAYSDSPRVDYAYYKIPADKATAETAEELLALDNVADVNVNAKRNTVAIMYGVKNLAAQKVLENVKAAGIAAELPETKK